MTLFTGLVFVKLHVARRSRAMGIMTELAVRENVHHVRVLGRKFLLVVALRADVGE